MSSPLINRFIAIAGPSGSGKTWLAGTLRDLFDHPASPTSVSVVAEDAYYRDQSHLDMTQRLQVNYDHPDALEHELMLSHLLSLREGVGVNSPVYDYKQHNRAREQRSVSPAGLVLVEGVHVLHLEAMRNLFDLRIYLETPLELCLQRRIERDIRERGRSEQLVRNQFASAVLPMYERFVLPASKHADLILGQSVITDAEINRLSEKIENLLVA